MVRLIEKFRREGVVIVGAGGAGDIVSAYVMCKVLKDLFSINRCLPLAILWERWILDPHPGPIPYNSLRNVRHGEGCIWVKSETVAVRDGYLFKPQASIVSDMVGHEIPAVTSEGGVSDLRKYYSELSELGYINILALDVGGDIIAEGKEESLWSPLTDAITLKTLLAFSLLEGTESFHNTTL